MKGSLELDIVSGSGVGQGIPNFDALSDRSNYRKDSQSTVAGPPSTQVPRATLSGVAELHVASGMPQWRMFVTCCYF